MGDLITLLIILIPTVLFFLIIFFAVLKGIIRGFRKSSILALQAIIALIICVILFIIFSNSEKVDSGLVGFINNFAGEGWLQRQMKVSESSTKLTEILYEFLPKQLNYGDGIALIIRDNGNYLLQLVLLIYKIILAFITSFVYLILVFIFYIIYLIFYPERRYKRKVNAKYELALNEANLNNSEISNDEIIETNQNDNTSVNDEDSLVSNQELIISEDDNSNIEIKEEANSNIEIKEEANTEEEREYIPPEEDITNVLIDVSPKKEKVLKPYRKRKLLGALIGGIRGFVTAIIVMSFIGSFFYIVGGMGDYDYTDKLEITDTNYDTTYEIYQSIGEYGKHGIFKVLNAIKTKDNMPFYLYAADLVFSGRIDDPKHGINKRFNFVDEIGAYTHFSRLTVDLLMKYGKDELLVAANGEADMLDTVIRIMTKEEFQNEFDKIIDDFDGKTYFINFTLSLLDSIIEHIDELTVADEEPDAVELVSLLFKKGSLTEYIPEEKVILDKLKADPNYQYETRPFINASSLLTKNDAKSLLKLVVNSLDVLNIEDTTEKILSISEKILPELSNLSILNGDRKDELNGVYERLYVFMDNKYVQPSLANATGSSEVEQDSAKNLLRGLDKNSFDWTFELNELLTSSVYAVRIAQNVYDPQKEVFDNVINMFGATNINREENINNYDLILNSLRKSHILDRVMSTNGMVSLIKNSLNEIIPDLYVPVLKYSDTNNNGVVVNGETYNLLSGFKEILLDEEAKNSLIEFKNNNGDDTEKTKNIKKVLTALVETKDDGTSILDTVLNSRLLRAAVSGIISSYSADSFEIIVPNNVKELEGDMVVNIIKKDELVSLASSVIKVMPDGEADVKELINKFIENRDEFLNSSVLNASMINIIVNGNESIKEIIIVPDELRLDATKEKLQDYNDNNAWIKTNELSKLLDSLDYGLNIRELNIDFNDSSSAQNVITDVIKELNNKVDGTNSTKLDICYNSNIMKLTITKNIKDKTVDTDFVVPEDAYDENETYNLDSNSYEIILKSELSKIINVINLLELDLNNLQFDYITLRKDDIEELSDSKMFRATISSQLVANNELIVPEDYTTFENGYISETELNNLLHILDENRFKLFGTSEEKINVQIDFNEEKIKSFYVEELKGFVKSNIFQATIINKLSSNTEYGLDIPSALVNESSKEYLKANYATSTWYLKQEISNIFVSLDNIFIDETTLGSINESIIKNKIFEDDFINNSYISIVLNNTISTKLYNELNSQNREEITNAEREFLYTKYSLDSSVNEYVYKEESVVKLLSGLKELGINNVDSISSADYTKCALDDNTDYDVLYDSVLLWDILSIKVDNNLENNSQIENRNEAYFDYLGVKFLNINELEDIRIIYNSNPSNSSKDLKDISASDIIVNETTEFAMSDSYILRATITSKIVNNDSVNVPSDSYDDSNNSLIKKTDLIDFLKIAEVLEIDLGNPNVNEINLNDEFNTIYANSRIFRSTLVDKLNDNSKGVVCDLALESNTLNNKYFGIDEAKLVLAKLTKYKNYFFTVNANGSVDISQVIIDADSLTIDVCKDLIDSITFYGIITLNIDTIDAIQIPTYHSEFISKDKIMNNFASNPWYMDNEIDHIFNSADIFINTNNKLNDFKTETIEGKVLNLTSSDIDRLYMSTVMIYTITDQIDSSVENQDGRSELREDIKQKDSKYINESINYAYYSKSEVLNTISAIKNANFESITELKTKEINPDTFIKDSSIDFEIINESVIVWDIFYTKLTEVINNNIHIIDHNAAKYNLVFNENNYEFYKVDEFNGLRLFVNGCNIDNISAFSIDNVKYNQNVSDSIDSSYLVRKTISNNVYNNENIIITENVIDASYNDLISSIELKALLDGIINGASVSLSGFDPESIKPNTADAELVSNSIIIRASMLNTILTDNSISIVDSEDYCESMKDINNNDVIVLTKQEIKCLINALKVLDLDKFDTNITFDALVNINNSDLMTLLASSIMHVSVSNLLLTGFIYKGVSINYDSYLTIDMEQELIGLDKIVEFEFSHEISGTKYYKNSSADTANLFDINNNEKENGSLCATYSAIAFIRNVNERITG